MVRRALDGRDQLRHISEGIRKGRLPAQSRLLLCVQDRAHGIRDAEIREVDLLAVRNLGMRREALRPDDAIVIHFEQLFDEKLTTHIVFVSDKGS